ncbi:conjugal transfer protein [Actinomadura atramentaria]|uniref:conjugal transfer protein n=1 Tax=Actinomadura atramentaria TaxID=1990 RepID=UPI0004781200|nr:conjugal transfer protein [Actinomadura atramentaria]
MARRSAVKNGRRTAGEDAATGGGLGTAADPFDAPDYESFDPGTRGGSRVEGGRHGGSGGRWWVWLGRAVLWALILVILVNGVRAPFERFTSDDSPGTAKPSPGKGTGFPTTAASAFALQFAAVYLNYDAKSTAAREAQLRSFLPDGAPAQFGWNNAGKLQVSSVQVAGIDARDAHNGTVTLLARNQDKWLRLAVPVYADGGALVVSGRPALLPPPSRATLPQNGVRERDTALETALTPILGTFFDAYAKSDQTQLSRFSAGSPIAGLGNSVTFVAVRGVTAPTGDPGRRVVTATVAWQLPATGGGAGGELEQDYRLDLVKKASDWYVRDVRGITEPSAP